MARLNVRFDKGIDIFTNVLMMYALMGPVSVIWQIFTILTHHIFNVQHTYMFHNYLKATLWL